MTEERGRRTRESPARPAAATKTDPRAKTPRAPRRRGDDDLTLGDLGVFARDIIPWDRTMRSSRGIGGASPTLQGGTIAPNERNSARPGGSPGSLGGNVRNKPNFRSGASDGKCFMRKWLWRIRPARPCEKTKPISTSVPIGRSAFPGAIMRNKANSRRGRVRRGPRDGVGGQFCKTKPIRDRAWRDGVRGARAVESNRAKQSQFAEAGRTIVRNEPNRRFRPKGIS